MVPTSDPEVMDAVGHVTGSQYRLTVVDELAAQVATPSDLEARTGVDLSHCSRALNELREEDVVTLLVDEDRTKGRYYGLTEFGEEVVDVLADLDRVAGGDA
jgi:DNA-binding HxlR family transcriptional regulator